MGINNNQQGLIMDIQQRYSQIKQLLLTAPDEQFDKPVRDLIANWPNEITSLHILEVLDNIAYFASASPFVQGMLMQMMTELLQHEGRTLEELEPLATWRTQYVG